MEARGKTIEQWFSMIQQGQIVLPRFQRHESWRHAQIEGLFENILRKPSLPIGALLVLEVGDRELFHSRPIVGAPHPVGRPQMHLLDGQQRMTALWRVLNDDYPDLTIFMSLEPHSSPVEPELGEIKSVLRSFIWRSDGRVKVSGVQCGRMMMLRYSSGT